MRLITNAITVENRERSYITILTYLRKKKQIFVSAKLETLQIYTFPRKWKKSKQLVMKAPRKLKGDVSYNFPNQFFEWKQIRQYVQSKTQTTTPGTKHTIPLQQAKKK